jgi:hypothetical protein
MERLLKMESITKDMYIMTTVNNISHEKLVSLLFSSYRARAENLKKLGIIPEKGNVNDLKWLILLFLQDRGYVSDIARIRLSNNDEQMALGIIDLILDCDNLKRYQSDVLQKLHKKRMSNEKKEEMLQLVEEIEAQIDRNDDFIGTFCRHVQIHKNKETEMIWGSFVKNKSIEKMLYKGGELTRKQLRAVLKET